VASKSIRDRLLTGSRIPLHKRATAIFFFADNLPATEVSKIVGISLDSARGIRDREQNLIMILKKTIAEEYLRLWEGHIHAYYNRETEKQYQDLWQQIRKTQKDLEKSFKLPPTANSQAPCS
jgi:hypothetical protein